MTSNWFYYMCLNMYFRSWPYIESISHKFRLCRTINSLKHYMDLVDTFVFR